MPSRIIKINENVSLCQNIQFSVTVILLEMKINQTGFMCSTTIAHYDPDCNYNKMYQNKSNNQNVCMQSLCGLSFCQHKTKASCLVLQCFCFVKLIVSMLFLYFMILYHKKTENTRLHLCSQGPTSYTACCVNINVLTKSLLLATYSLINQTSLTSENKTSR